jgi:Fe-S-cluster containining protein
MSKTWTRAEETLFETTGAEVLRGLQRARNPADLLGVIRRAHLGFDRAEAAAPAAARGAIACRAGCGACCHVLVGVQAHEVLIVAEHIQTHFSPAELDEVIARTAAQVAAFKGLAYRERWALQRPCALLDEDSCSVHEARPEACRAHHSSDVEACHANYDAAEEKYDATIPGLHGRMFAVMLAIDQAAVEAGLDGRAYDFGSALHEALTDSRCAIRWMNREAAFSDACLEYNDAGDGGAAGTIRPAGFFTE